MISSHLFYLIFFNFTLSNLLYFFILFSYISYYFILLYFICFILPPLRFAKSEALKKVLNQLYSQGMLSRFVIDEAHCLSQVCVCGVWLCVCERERKCVCEREKVCVCVCVCVYVCVCKCVYVLSSSRLLAHIFSS